MKWYGSKEKAMEAIMQSTGDAAEIKQEQDENTKIYKLFMSAKECDNASHIKNKNKEVRYVNLDILEMGTCEVMSSSGNRVRLYNKE